MKKCSDMANIIKESLPQLLSPNAAELGRYGKNPVNYFSGLPGIVVPLTSVHAKGYELPDGTTRSFKACTYPADPELFDKAILKTSPASITVSRSLAFPVNTDED